METAAKLFEVLQVCIYEYGCTEREEKKGENEKAGLIFSPFFAVGRGALFELLIPFRNEVLPPFLWRCWDEDTLPPLSSSAGRSSTAAVYIHSKPISSQAASTICCLNLI